MSAPSFVTKDYLTVSTRGCKELKAEIYYLTHTVQLPIILVKRTMVQSTGTNKIGRDWYTKPLNLNNEPVPRCAQLMLLSGFQSVKF